jgi:hypothetical protein
MRISSLASSLACVLAFCLFSTSVRARELELQNGWTHAPFSTSRAEAFLDSGILHLKGAVAGGTTSLIATLPPLLRPDVDVYLMVDLCGAKKGRLWIRPNGEVSVDSFPEPFTTAQCFTSLDGAQFRMNVDFSFTLLTLQNGWVGAPFSTGPPQAGLADGRVYLKGAMSSGTSTFAFTLPPGLRPETVVWIPVDLCTNTKGRLRIDPSGNVVVNGPFASAQCFTSLDGASFVPSAPGSTPLALINGWSQYGDGTSDAAVSMTDGIVFFKGAIKTSGPNDIAFVLPPTMRSATTAYVPVDLFGNAKGRLVIRPNGEVQIQAAIAFSDAQGFTSLDGASFIPTPPGFQLLALESDWVDDTSGTRPAAAALYDGIVHFQGAVANGTTNYPITLPVSMRPDATVVYVPVDLCDGNVGQLVVWNSGAVGVYSPTGFATAQCATSLEGVTFARTATGFTALGLMNGWNGGSGDYAPMAAIVDGMVHLKGIMSNGTTGAAFNLPPAMRPALPAYVVISLCNFTKGRLRIETGGDVFVETLEPYSQAQCGSLLDGAKFAPASNAGFTPLSPINGWFASVFADAPGYSLVRDIVYLKGALGTSGLLSQALSLPATLRPSGNVYLPLDLCDSNKGRLLVEPTGGGFVSALTDFAHAQCFTSLDGVSYAVPEPTGASALVAGLLLLAGAQRARVRRMRMN